MTESELIWEYKTLKRRYRDYSRVPMAQRPLFWAGWKLATNSRTVPIELQAGIRKEAIKILGKAQLETESKRLGAIEEMHQESVLWPDMDRDVGE